MPTYKATVAGLGAITVDGTKPFAKVQEGGPSGAYRIVDAAGVDAKLRINGETVTSVIAKRASTEVTITALLAAIAAAVAV